MRTLLRRFPTIVPLMVFGVTSAFALFPFRADAGMYPDCLEGISSRDGVLLSDNKDRILCQRNAREKFPPASTLKLLTALAALHHLGADYRYPTDFYIDGRGNLKVKGYGDPFLISEVLRDIATSLSKRLSGFDALILDPSYLSPDISVPGLGCSTNPYDAPPGAICANFNTVSFEYDSKGRIVTGEPQTPMMESMQERIRALGLKTGRRTFTHDQEEAARYAGELLLTFLEQRGVRSSGNIRIGSVREGDRLIFTYRSRFTLGEVLEKMFQFSSNFVANQILVSLGARIHGIPGTCPKGARVLSDYAENKLHLKGIKVVEGSGISRENRLSPMHMRALLRRFEPYRHLLRGTQDLRYKTGTLKGIQTQVGYIEAPAQEGPYTFVIFLNGSGIPMGSVLKCLKRTVKKSIQD